MPLGQSWGRGDEEKGGAPRGYIGARMATSKTQTSPWERLSMPGHFTTSLPHAEWLCDTRAQELQRERMVPSKRYRPLDLTRKSEAVACRTPTLSESPPSLDKQQRRGGGTPTLIRVVDGSPRGVALGAKNCLDDSRTPISRRTSAWLGSISRSSPYRERHVAWPQTPLAIAACRASEQLLRACRQRRQGSRPFIPIPCTK
jgi:hypothetical protein